MYQKLISLLQTHMTQSALNFGRPDSFVWVDFSHVQLKGKQQIIVRNSMS